MFDLSSPRVMGILNATPDSFSDGGKYQKIDHALLHALAMQAQGAAIIDVGGESTRPDARAVTVQEELDRVIPIIEKLVSELAVPISIDTSKAEVMRAAVQAGAAMINDVNALQSDGALTEAVRCAVPVCLMHMAGNPRTMQQSPEYKDVVTEVESFLSARMTVCIDAGMDRNNIIIDPGFGFGKTLQHNLSLLRELDTFAASGVPVLVGISRKSFLGTLTGKDADNRLAASLSAAVLAVERGAKILRVHDVAETVDAVKVAIALREEG